MNQLIGRLGAGLSGDRRKVHREKLAILILILILVFIFANCQRPAETRFEVYSFEFRRQRVEHYPGRCEGRVAAQPDLAAGRKPAQFVEIALQ